MIPIEAPRRQPAPRWAVCCVMAALYAVTGRGEHAWLYVEELTKFVASNRGAWGSS